jgi:hypothetical protein
VRAFFVYLSQKYIFVFYAFFHHQHNKYQRQNCPAPAHSACPRKRIFSSCRGGDTIYNKQVEPESSRRICGKAGTDNPKKADCCPKVADRYPKVADDYPKVADRYPKVADCYPKVADDYPKVADCYPKAADDYPKVADCYPKTADDYPPSTALGGLPAAKTTQKQALSALRANGKLLFSKNKMQGASA